MTRLTFLRKLIHRQVNEMPLNSFDFVSSSIGLDIEPASGNLTWDAAAFDYKTPQYI